MAQKRPEIRCQCCGETIKKIDKRNYPDYLSIDKTWGYFSNKDLERHRFIICERCYDRWTSSFVLPIDKEEVLEAFGPMYDGDE